MTESGTQSPEEIKSIETEKYMEPTEFEVQYPEEVKSSNTEKECKN